MLKVMDVRCNSNTIQMKFRQNLGAVKISRAKLGSTDLKLQFLASIWAIVDHDGQIQNIGVNIALLNNKTLNERI